jgi:hypothetical protein
VTLGFDANWLSYDASTATPEELVVSRVNHCDLRGLEGAALVGPTERGGSAVVVLDEANYASCQLVNRGELASSQ